MLVLEADFSVVVGGCLGIGFFVEDTEFIFGCHFLVHKLSIAILFTCSYADVIVSTRIT